MRRTPVGWFVGASLVAGVAGDCDELNFETTAIHQLTPPVP
jgi:hypothetical protein